MSKQWRFMLATVIVCSLAVTMLPAQSGSEPGEASGFEAASHSAEQQLLAVRVDSDVEGRPVVTLDSSDPVTFESFVLDGPDRLVLDLPGVVSQLTDYRYTVGQSGVARVRAAQHRVAPNPVTRVVFDLEGPLAYSIDRAGSALIVTFGDGSEDVAWNPRREAGAEPTVVPEPVAVTPPVTETARVETAEVEVPAAAPEKPETNAEVVETPEPVADNKVADVTNLIEEMAARNADWTVTPEAPVEPVEVVEVAEVKPVVAPAPTPVAEPVAVKATDRAVDADALQQLITAPAFAAPTSEIRGAARGSDSYQSKTISGSTETYSGKRISINLTDADLKQVFRFFHEISGLNFVLDPEVSGTVTIVLDQVPWDQALDIILKNNGLDKVLDNNVLRIASTQKLAREAASRKQLKEAEELEVEPITLTRTLSYAKAKDVEKVIRDGGILSPRGRVIIDERTNTLIISDIPKKVEPLDTLITVLDAETPQVMIEARIVETSRTYSKDLGVEWGFNAKADASSGTATGLQFPHNGSVNYGFNPPTEQLSSLAFSFGNVVDSFTLDLALNTLEEEGQGRILSSPRIATQNNERAEIEQGVRIPIVNTTATEIDVEFVSASLRLEVTPQITAEGTIILDLVVENNSPDFNNTAADIPSIRTQRAQTKVLINDGGTTVIGGIFTVNEGSSEIGVPWFRKIPIFGWLFKSTNVNTENIELLIFVTPKIVSLG